MWYFDHLDRALVIPIGHLFLLWMRYFYGGNFFIVREHIVYVLIVPLLSIVGSRETFLRKTVSDRVHVKSLGFLHRYFEDYIFRWDLNAVGFRLTVLLLHLFERCPNEKSSTHVMIDINGI